MMESVASAFQSLKIGARLTTRICAARNTITALPICCCKYSNKNGTHGSRYYHGCSRIFHQYSTTIEAIGSNSKLTCKHGYSRIFNYRISLGLPAVLYDISLSSVSGRKSYWTDTTLSCASDSDETKVPSDINSKDQALQCFAFKTNLCSTDDLEAFQDIVLKDLIVREDFISKQEEISLVEELARFFKRSKYSFDHWDGAIEGFRETEKSQWKSQNTSILKRMQLFCYGETADMLPAVHVLDLAEDGYIKPHIDSNRFCGERIAGLSLLSPSIMRFKRPDDDSIMVDVLLKRRSLYLMRGKVRYEMTHEILKRGESYWNGKEIDRGRRVSIILREEKMAEK